MFLAEWMIITTLFIIHLKGGFLRKERVKEKLFKCVLAGHWNIEEEGERKM